MALVESRTEMRDAMRTVKSMCDADAEFEHVEAYVESQQGLDGEERALLWLYAFLGADVEMIDADLGRVARPVAMV